MLNCINSTNLDIEDWGKCNGDTILYVAIGHIGTLLLIVGALLVVICYMARKYRRIKSYSLGGKENFKDNTPALVELGGIGEENDEEHVEAEATCIEDNKPNKFAEVMYTSVECTPATNNNTKQPNASAQGQHVLAESVDSVSQDVITHEEQHRVKHTKGEIKKKEVKKVNVKKKEVKKKRVRETEDVVRGCAPSDKEQTQKEQNEPTFDSDVYNKLVHVTPKSQPRRPFSTDYSQIALAGDDGRSSILDDGSKLNQRQRRRRTSSPPNKTPPLPPPFVDDEFAEAGGIANYKASHQTDVGGARRQKTFGISAVEVTTQHANAGPFIYHNIFNDGEMQGLGAALYDDPASSPPRQDVYVNVVKR